FGPDANRGFAGDRLHDAVGRRLAAPFGGPTLERDVRVEMGTQGACVTNICSPKLSIGRALSDILLSLQSRTLNHVHWDAISNSINLTSTAGNPHMGESDPPDTSPYDVGQVNYAYCFA